MDIYYVNLPLSIKGVLLPDEKILFVNINGCHEETISDLKAEFGGEIVEPVRS